MALRRLRAQTKRLAFAGRGTGAHAGGGGDESRPEAAGIRVRGTDDLLRLHAGHRHGQRSVTDCFRHPELGGRAG